jgi:DeoR family transcriptional regulator, fructose operon transcriptional repressor
MSSKVMAIAVPPVLEDAKSHMSEQRRQGGGMSTIQGTLASEARLQWLRDCLAADGSVTIAAAAEALGVSEMTVRRDLVELEERGSARRVRGGATASGPRPFSERHTVAARAKSRIAAKLAPMLPEVGFVAFDASSTVMRAASNLDAARDLSVLTNSPDTFAVLQGKSGVHPLLTGGRLDPQTGSLVGPLACRSAAQLHVDLFIASAAAIDPDAGAREATLDEAEVKRSIAAGATTVVLAVDASKLGAGAVAVGLDWDVIDTLVTDLDPADDRLTPYRARATIF